MSEKEKELVLKHLDSIGVDTTFLIRESFLGYKWRKERDKLYGRDEELPTKLIKMYYELNPDRIHFDRLKSAFVRKYIRNESKLECVHSPDEVKGLEKMYEYIHSDDIDYRFDVYTLLDLHAKLFSLVPHPEAGGQIRNDNVYLPGSGVELCDWRDIRRELNKIDERVQCLVEMAPEIKKFGDADDLLAYLDLCIEVKCGLIKIHPFMDGNGRTIRGFVNKLFEDAGLPPVYILERERGEYQKAMNKALLEDDYSDIKNFYRYKVCDSIVELDINDRVSERNRKSYKVREKNSSKK